MINVSFIDDYLLFKQVCFVFVFCKIVVCGEKVKGAELQIMESIVKVLKLFKSYFEILES